MGDELQPAISVKSYAAKRSLRPDKMDSARILSRSHSSQRLAALSASTFLSGYEQALNNSAGSTLEQTIVANPQLMPLTARAHSSLPIRICAKLSCAASVCAIAGTLAGCGGSIIQGNATTASHSLATPSLSAKITPESPVPLGTTAVLEWNTKNAAEVQVEGEDIYSTRPDGSQTISPSHRSIYFFSANNQAGSAEENLVVDVIVPEAQQVSTHAEWLEELPSALATLQCGSNTAYQQPGQSRQDALATAMRDPTVSCLVLQPASTTSEVVYYEGLAAESGTTQIRYISDLPEVMFPDSI